MSSESPKIGRWYVNLTGQFFKVFIVCYSPIRISKVVLESLSGRKTIITIEEWFNLKLEVNLFKGVSGEK